MLFSRIGGVMIRVLASCVRAPNGSNQRLWNWYLLLLR